MLGKPIAIMTRNLSLNFHENKANNVYSDM